MDTYTEAQDRDIFVDASEARDKAGFLAALARDLQFPAYFGGNWDAVEECLADHAWPSDATTTIVIKSAAPLAAAHPDVLRTFEDIVRNLPSVRVRPELS
jgi:RNAse (barnase) inhibitor barstar